jgi:AcrR family transcriptional regulator
MASSRSSHLPQLSNSRLEPRKLPVQARSTASVEAILEATLQVLLEVGKERLTTTRVAQRAGVSVGTLYQYFPNKSSLMQALLKGHLNRVAAAVEAVCEDQKGQSLSHMATALTGAFLEAKLRNVEASVALYFISDDLDGAEIVRQMGVRTNKAVAQMLASASEALTTDPEVVANTLLAAMSGVSRRVLESPAPRKLADALRHELVVLAGAYLNACTVSEKTAVLESNVK